MDVSKDYRCAANVDPFGVSWYLDAPGRCSSSSGGSSASCIGGVDLYHMRLLHAIVGLLTVAACYALFRQMLPRALGGLRTVLVGVSHSMFMISRLAMRENTARPRRRRRVHPAPLGASGSTSWRRSSAVSSPGSASTSTSRAASRFPLWIALPRRPGASLPAAIPAPNAAEPRRDRTSQASLLDGGPDHADRRVEDPAGQRSRQRDRLFIYNEAREEQQRLGLRRQPVGRRTRRTSEFGLGDFNNNVVDHCLDLREPRPRLRRSPDRASSSGSGSGVVGLALIRAGERTKALCSCWAGSSSSGSRSPSSSTRRRTTRDCCHLPFVAYLVTEAVRWIAGRWRSMPIRRRPSCRCGRSAVIVVWNLAIAWDFVEQGPRRRGADRKHRTLRRGAPG